MTNSNRVLARHPGTDPQSTAAACRSQETAPTLLRLRILGSCLLMAGCATTVKTEPSECIAYGPTNDTTPLDASATGGNAERDASEPSSTDDTNMDGGTEPSGDVAADAGTAVQRIGTDDYVSELEVALHSRVRTLVSVSWEQLIEADETWLEFSFEGGPAQRSPAKGGEIGSHQEMVLGVPESTDVTIQVVSQKDAVLYVASEATITTGVLPAGLPRPEILQYDAARVSPERYLFGSVEDSPGGRYYAYYTNTFWLYIMDRQGRIVWFYAEPASNATSSFQRIAKDGQYIWIEKRAYGGGGTQSVVKTTLDGRYREELEVPGLADAIDVTDHGSLLYDAGDELRELTSDGNTRRIWSCPAHFGGRFECYSNTVNWSAATDSVLLSFPYENTVVEIDRESGEVLAQFGNRDGSWDFAPPLTSPPEQWAFSFQHFPNFTDDGTLLVSTHMPGCGRNAFIGPYRHGFVEFEVDRRRRRLTEVWRYSDGREWPQAKGMAIRLANGNTLANYGTGGVIREITPGGRTVFMVKFDTPGGSDYFNKMVGHNVLIDDLYALNGGPD